MLGGEDPIDHVQRTRLRSGRDVHPLLRRIMQIHVTEEARHLCFARHYLEGARAAGWARVRRFILSRRAPFILAIMAQLMMRPSAQIVRTYGIPGEVIREAYTRNPEHRGTTLEALAQGARAAGRDRGSSRRRAARLWRWLGIWTERRPGRRRRGVTRRPRRARA